MNMAQIETERKRWGATSEKCVEIRVRIEGVERGFRMVHTSGFCNLK